MLIGIAGLPGAGKTTLTQALARHLGAEMALESVGEANPWLEPYYANGEAGRREYALRLQLHFLATRLESMRQIRSRAGIYLLDRTWYEDAEIFARGCYEQGAMTAADFDLYERLYTELLHSPAAHPPAALIYLDAPLETIVARIHQRGRAKERDTELAYWEQLYARYGAWLASFDRCPVVKLDIRRYDLLRDPMAIYDIAEHLYEAVGCRLTTPALATSPIPTPPPTTAALPATPRR